VVHESARQEQAAPLAARQARRTGVALVLEPEGRDQLVGARAGLLHPEVAAVVHQRLAHGEEAVEVDVLLRQPYPRASGQGVVRLPEHANLA
jgi:hypothetical protein